MFKKNLVLTLAVLVIFSFILTVALADEVYPEKSVKLLVGFSAGGPTDVPARIIASNWEKLLGQSILVVNKTGAGGQISWSELSKSEADGYTLGVINVPGCNMIAMRPGVDFSIEDFDFIGCNIVDFAAVMVRKDSPFNSFEEVLNADKEKPGKVILGLNGPASDDQLALLMIQDAVQHKFPSQVMFPEGEAQAAVALLGEHVDVLIGNASTCGAHPNDIKILTMLSKERVGLFPNVPTFKESTGIEVIEFSARGFGAPKGIPEDRFKIIAETFEKAVNDPETISALQKVGFSPVFWDSEEYGNNAKMLTKMLEKYRKDLGF